MKVDRFVSVIAPLQNDGDIIESFVADTVPILRETYSNYELVLIDDGSEDDTTLRVRPLLKEYEGIRLIRLSRPFGLEVAISAGLETVIGDYVVVMLPHMDPPELIPALVDRSIDGIDVVIGVSKSLARNSWLYRKAADFYFAYCKRFLKLELPRNSTQLRCLSRQAVNAIIQIKDSYRYLRLSSSYVGFANGQFHYEPLLRQGKVKQRSFIETVNNAIGLVIENSPHPLRLISWFGLTAACVNLLYILYIVLIYLFREKVMEGWTTLSMQNAGQFFFITLTLTALSEYVGRILNRLRDRPLYYVMGEMDSSVLLVDRERRNIVSESDGIFKSKDEDCRESNYVQSKTELSAQIKKSEKKGECF
jgi:glycosyltransferase involved in cell wall biosynthesis